MKNHFKVITNIILTSISLSVGLGTFLKIVGPIHQINKENRKINIVGELRKINEKESAKIDSQSLLSNKLDGFRKLEELNILWESLISQNPDLEVSCFFLSIDDKAYAEINSEINLPAASSIKVPILIVLLTMIDSKEILWNEELILTEDSLGSGSGWMAYEKLGVKFPIFEVASEMIRVSDNTATNLLIKRLGGINLINKKFKQLGLKNTKINNYLPDLKGTNITSSKDLIIAMTLVDNGYLLSSRSRDIFREIMRNSKTNTLIPSGILRGLGKEAEDIDYHLSLKGYTVYNKTGDIGISYSDIGLIQTPQNSRAIASFIVKGPFNDPRSPELIRKLSEQLIPFLEQAKK